MKDLWVEKYRPSSIDTYVFRDDNQRKQVTGWKITTRGGGNRFCL